MANVKDPTMTEHFGWKFHPFADTWRLDQPFCSDRDQRIIDQALQLLQHGKSFALTSAVGCRQINLDPTPFIQKNPKVAVKSDDPEINKVLFVNPAAVPSIDAFK